MELLSLALLFLAIILGFLRHMNTGLLSIAFAMVLARIAGISDKSVIAGFNYSLFLILLGVLTCSASRSLTALWRFWRRRLSP